MTSPLSKVRAALRRGPHGLHAQPETRGEGELDTRALVRRNLRRSAAAPGHPSAVAVVAFAGGSRLRSGLSLEWDQVDLDPHGWRATLARQDLDLCVLEVGGSTIAGWADGPSPAQLATVSAEHGVPVVAWVTGLTDRHTQQALVAAGAALHSIHPDPDNLDGDTRFLPPATQPRQQTATHKPGTERPGDVVVLDGQRSPAAAGVLGRRRAEILHDWEQDGSEPALSPDQPLSAQYRVLADVGVRAPADNWPVLDALACRTAVVTTPERRDVLPTDLRDIVSAPAPEALNRHLNVLLRQPELRDRVTHLGHRAVLAGHTLGDRARVLLRAGGLEPVDPARSVSVVVPTNRPHELENVLANVARQERVDAQLILVAHGFEVDQADLTARAADLGLTRLQVVHAAPELTLGAALNLGIDASDGAYVAKMDDDNFYGAHFLGDLVDTFAHTSAGITGKWAHYVWLRSTGAVVLRYGGYENTYHRLVQGGSILTHREVAEDLRFSDIPRAVDSDFLNRAMAAGVSTYSGDRYNFVSIRGHDRTGHTWQVDDAIFMTGSGRVVTYGDPRELVSV